jgi:hypothetical protein
MKNWKQKTFSLWAIIVSFGIIVGFTACPPDDNGKNNLCSCNPKEHYLPCNCGGDDCTCNVLPRGYVSDIPIYQTAGVSDADAVATVAKINTAWNIVILSKTKTYLVANVTRIEMVDAEDFTLNSGILQIGTSGDALDIGEALDDLVATLLGQ